MSSNISAFDKECGNCIHWKKNALNTPGRSKGECGKGQGQRYYTDYCWRWEGLLNGSVENVGGISDTSGSGRITDTRTIGDNRPRPADKTPKYTD